MICTKLQLIWPLRMPSVARPDETTINMSNKLQANLTKLSQATHKLVSGDNSIVICKIDLQNGQNMQLCTCVHRFKQLVQILQILREFQMSIQKAISHLIVDKHKRSNERRLVRAHRDFVICRLRSNKPPQRWYAHRIRLSAVCPSEMPEIRSIRRSQASSQRILLKKE